MANGKNDRSKRVSPLAAIIGIAILAIASFLGIDLTGAIPNETVIPVVEETIQTVEDVEGQLIVHMIDVGQADCFLLVQDDETALVDCGTRSTGKDAVASQVLCAETEIEEKILENGDNIDAEILKLGHHGSDTSSCDAFLDAVSPEYGLISCKIGNKYEHPIKSTMEKLQERNVEIYRTDECGSVIVILTTDNVTFNCEPGDYLSGVELEERESK